MTDGKRSLVGMGFGAVGALLIAGMFLAWNFAHAGLPFSEWASRLAFGVLWLWPYFLFYLGVLLICCVLVGGLAGYCLGPEDGAGGGGEGGR